MLHRPVAVPTLEETYSASCSLWMELKVCIVKLYNW
jgi:hypothetical protein